MQGWPLTLGAAAALVMLGILLGLRGEARRARGLLSDSRDQG